MNDQDKIPADVLINGGMEITVTLKTGAKETVKVLLVPLSKASRYVEFIDDLTLFTELVTAKPAGWADTLEDDSVYEIDELAKKLNDPRIDRFLQRQLKTVERMAPTAQAMRKAVASTSS